MSRTTQSFQESCLVIPGVDTTTPSGPPACGTVDPRCADPVFATANPTLCGGYVSPIATLVLKPAVAHVAVSGSMQYSAVISQNGTEFPVSSGVLYASSNTSVGSIGLTTGTSVGVAPGVVTITATWHGLSAFAQLTVVDSCADATADFVLLLDNSKSMGLAFSQSYATKLAYAKAIAKSFATHVDFTTDHVAVVDFNTAGAAVLALSASSTAIQAAVTAVPQTQSNTSIASGITAATNALASSTASRKVIVLFSDGENRPPDGDTSGDPLVLAKAFTDAGGLFISVGIRSFSTGYQLLNSMASGGFFLNAFDTVAAATSTYLNGFTGYTCSSSGGGYIAAPPVAQVPDPHPLTDVEVAIIILPPPTYVSTQTYTASCPGLDVGDPVTRTETYTSLISQLDADTRAMALAQQSAYADLTCCANAVAINDLSTSTPYPACFKVANFSGSVTAVTVKLTGFSHQYPSDVSMVLVGPLGQSVLLMSGCGGGTSVDDLTIIFSDSGIEVPTSALTSTTYSPTGGGTLPPLPSPQFNYTTFASAFNGLDPNGVWKLYVNDTKAVDIGRIRQWEVIINGNAVCGCDTYCTNTYKIPSVVSQFSFFNPCVAATDSVLTAWNGQDIAPTVDGFWDTTDAVAGATRSLAGKQFSSVTLQLRGDSDNCYYQLAVYSARVVTTPTSTDTVGLLAWIGRKSATFNANPAGVYDFVNAADPLGQYPCGVNAPATITVAVQ